MLPVDVVVVSYNSRSSIRDCVSALLGHEHVDVIVVDNASSDGSPDALRNLPVRLVERTTNDGFGAGCNAGWRSGTAPAVLFLNPDARIDVESVARLASVLEGDERVGAVAPRIVADDGTLDFSLRRFPRLRSTFGRALFLHRLFPDAQWVDEVVREPAAYARPSDAEWTSGACLLVRRSALELVGGFDEGFFMYCEDTDLCRRLWDAGYSVRYEPAAEAVHEGGVSAPRTSLLGTLVASRLRYARKHAPPAVRTLERVGLAVEELLRTVVGGGGAAARRGHAAALRVALAGRPGRAARSRG